MMKTEAVLNETLGRVLDDKKSRRWHAGLVIAGLSIVLITWPTKILQDFFAGKQGPRTFQITVLIMAPLMIIASAAFALDRAARDSGHSFVRWIKFTPMTPGKYLWGRMLFHFLHTLILSALVLPFFLMAGAASVLPPEPVWKVLAVLAAALFCYRNLAEGFRSLDPSGNSIVLFLFNIALAAYLLSSLAAFPQWSLVRVLSLLSMESDPFVSAWIKTGSLHVAAALFGLTLALFRLKARTRELRPS